MKKYIILPAVLWLMLLPAASINATGRLASEVERQLRATILNDGGDYVITVPDFMIALPAQYDSVRVESLGEGKPLGSCWIKVYFYKEGAAFQTINTNIQVNLYQNVLVSKDAIKADELLTPDMFARMRCDVTSFTEPAILLADDLKDMTAARPIPKGKALTVSMMAPEEVVKRGDLVTIEYSSGAIKVTASGEAKQPGALGETIKVRNVSSNKIISAVVQDDKSVKVAK